MYGKTILAALLASTFLTTAAQAAVIDVSQGESIQEAINRSSNGDTIRVQQGEYSSFQITKSNIRVESAVKGGAHIIATGKDQPAIGSYGQSNVTVTGFRLTSKDGDGVKIGGSPGKPVSGITFADNTTVWAKLDGLKFFQMSSSRVTGNTVEMAGGGGSAGSSRNPNGDGGMDFVTVTDSTISNNTVQDTNGWAALMLKTASDSNTVENNTLNNSDKRGVGMTVGGVSGGQAAQATGTTGDGDGKEARNNLIRNNEITSAGCGYYFKDANNNRMEGNKVSDKGGCPKTDGTNNENAQVSAMGSGSSTTGARNSSGNYSNDGDGMSNILGGAGKLIGGSCASSAMLSDAMSAAGTVVSIYNGGKATAPLQIAQQIQLIAQRICQQQSLLAQIRMLAGMNLSTVDDVLMVLDVLDPIMNQVGFDIPPRSIDTVMEVIYPVLFPEDGTQGSKEEQVIIWNETTTKNLRSTAQVQNAAIQEQRKGLNRVKKLEEAGRSSGGIRGAQLGTNAILTEMMGALNNQTTAIVSHQRSLTEIEMRNESERAAAKRDAKDFMKTLGNCDGCGSKNNPFDTVFAGNASSFSSVKASSNQVFGTGIK